MSNIGFLVIHPALAGYRPAPQQVESLITLLEQEGVLGERNPSPASGQAWFSGPRFDRLVISCYGTFAHIAIDQADECAALDGEAVEPWERTLSQQLIWNTIWDAGPPEVLERSDPMWERMERALGCRLTALYYHV